MQNSLKANHFRTIPRPFSFSLALLILAVLSLTSPALADENDANTQSSVNGESPLGSLYTCSDIQDGAARLACYDASVAKLRTAEQNKEVVAIDAKAARKIKREAFGFNLPSLSKIGLPKISLPGSSTNKPEPLVAPVKSVRTVGRVLVITLDNGQVWKEVGGRLNYVPKGKLTATIKPKSVGSYIISLNNGKTTVRGLRVRRIE